jgi:hypothetical protein
MLMVRNNNFKTKSPTYRMGSRDVGLDLEDSTKQIRVSLNLIWSQGILLRDNKALERLRLVVLFELYHSMNLAGEEIDMISVV